MQSKNNKKMGENVCTFSLYMRYWIRKDLGACIRYRLKQVHYKCIPIKNLKVEVLNESGSFYRHIQKYGKMVSEQCVTK